MKNRCNYSGRLLRQYRNMQMQERKGVVFSKQKAEQFISDLKLLVEEHSAKDSNYNLLEAC